MVDLLRLLLFCRESYFEEQSLKIVKLKEDATFYAKKINNLKRSVFIKKILDLHGDNILVLASKGMSNYLIVFRIFNSKSAINVFEMMQLYPSAAKIYKQYLVTLSLNDGLIEIRDIMRNEGNVVYSMINSNAIGETLCVMYDKILYWERSQINIIFVKFFDEQNDKTKDQITENVKKSFDHHPTIKSRSIKESVVTIFFL